MSRYRSKSSSSEEGELSDKESDDPKEEIEPIEQKVKNTKLWSNVMLDQTADEVVSSVNAFGGNTGNRSVESYQAGRRRKRKRSTKSDGPFGETENSLLSNDAVPEMHADQPSPGKKRKCVVYDDANNLEDDDNLDKLDSGLENKAAEPYQIPKELDITFEDVIIESSAFLQRAEQRNMRPRKDASSEEVVEYLKWVLNEKNVELLGRLLEVKTVGFVFYALDQTIKKEIDGGILTNSGIRRRLPGGVFISNLKKFLSPFERFVVLDGKTQSEAKEILERNMNKKNKKRAAKQRKKLTAQRKLQDGETLPIVSDATTDKIVADVLNYNSDSNEQIPEIKAEVCENVENGLSEAVIEETVSDIKEKKLEEIDPTNDSEMVAS